jgi:hypothetical protein
MIFISTLLLSVVLVMMLCASRQASAKSNRAMSACWIVNTNQQRPHNRRARKDNFLASTMTTITTISTTTTSLMNAKAKARSGGGGGFATKKHPTNDAINSKKKSSRTPSDADDGNSSDSDSSNTTTKQKKGLVQISTSPALFIFDDFMDPDECRNLTQETSEAFCLAFRDKIYSQLLLGGVGHDGDGGGHDDDQQQQHKSALDGMKFNYASSQDANNDASERITFPDGLHLDTNNDCLFRHLTAILYLNDVAVEHGGSTMFPLARIQREEDEDDGNDDDDDHPVMAASRRLLEAKICHTRSCGTVRKSGKAREADAALLENSIMTTTTTTMLEGGGGGGTSTGAIRVQPQAGKLLLFFSRLPETGAEDPRSWHGGERLRDTILLDDVDDDNNGSSSSSRSVVTEKKILTIFKQVDYGLVEPTLAASTLETYLSHQIQTHTKLLLDRCQR